MDIEQNRLKAALICKKQRGIYPGIHRKEIMCFHKNRRYFIFRGSAKQGVCLYVK
mgnify:CR=1 FL=1